MSPRGSSKSLEDNNSAQSCAYLLKLYLKGALHAVEKRVKSSSNSRHCHSDVQVANWRYSFFFLKTKTGLDPFFPLAEGWILLFTDIRNVWNDMFFSLCF
jgi:hypothetical protein